MPGRNILELEADVDIDGDRAFEHEFAPLVVHEIMLDFDPKRVGPPLCVLSGQNGATKELKPLPQHFRPGHYVQRVDGDEAWTRLRITIAKGKSAHLKKVKLIAKGAGGTAPSAGTPPASAG